MNGNDGLELRSSIARIDVDALLGALHVECHWSLSRRSGEKDYVFLEESEHRIPFETSLFKQATDGRLWFRDPKRMLMVTLFLPNTFVTDLEKVRTVPDYVLRAHRNRVKRMRFPHEDYHPFEPLDSPPWA